MKWVKGLYPFEARTPTDDFDPTGSVYSSFELNSRGESELPYS